MSAGTGAPRPIWAEHVNRCPRCGKPVVKTAHGGRPKRFCNDRCQRTHWQAIARTKTRATTKRPARVGVCKRCGDPTRARSSFGPVPTLCERHRRPRNQGCKRETCACGAPVPARRLYHCSSRCADLAAAEARVDRDTARVTKRRAKPVRCVECRLPIRLKGCGGIPSYCSRRCWQRGYSAGRRVGRGGGAA